MEQEGFLDKKILKPIPFSFYAVWFDKYHVGETVFAEAFLEVFLDAISNSELFQGLFMITTGVVSTRNQFCGGSGRWMSPTGWDILISGRPPVFLA